MLSSFGMPLARRPNHFLQDRISRSTSHAALTATTASTNRVFAAPVGRSARLRRASYTNPTGLAESGANYFEIQVRKNGTDLMALWSTETSPTGEGTIPANTHVELVLASDSDDLVLAPGEWVDVNYAETGTATLPADGLLDLEFDLL